MLNWLNVTTESESLENARARARERSEQAAEASAAYVPPGMDGLVVEEISAEEFMRLFQPDHGKAA